jgi:uncharacterized repeat protein (TIGR01451 family)
MNASNQPRIIGGIRLLFVLVVGFLTAIAVITFARQTSYQVHAAPIDPPDGYPKFNTSTMVVSPTLAHMGGATLQYVIEIHNTGAYAAEGARLTNIIPNNTTYNEDAWASSYDVLTYTNGVLLWEGDVGFDGSVVISYSVTVSPTFEGLVQNVAVIEHDLISDPVTVIAETMVTELSILTITKTSAPEKPGPGKPLTYIITVTNQGQFAQDLPVVVTDVVPLNTQSPDGDMVTWERLVTLDTGDTSEFTFTVSIDDVVSGTVIANDDYRVANPESGVTVGEPYTVTVVDPILYIHKSVQPYPPGSNRAMTYTLTVLNKGSLATDLVVQDQVPDGVDYVSGGSYSGGVVTWNLEELDTDESAQFSFTVEVGDVADIEVINENYSVCAIGEGVCQYGSVLLSLIQGPTFDVSAMVDPIAKKPGGGPISKKTTVTPTFVIENLGPGSALEAVAQMYFKRISVSFTDLNADPNQGTFYVGPDCGEKCDSYVWVGDLAYGETITLTTVTGQSTIGGEEGTHYTATVVITDSLGAFTSAPITATAIGTVTHYANLIPIKTAPSVVAAGQILTYTIDVNNTGLSTDVPPYPVLTETIPLSTALHSVSDDGVYLEGDRTIISWTLPALSTGEGLVRSFSVLVDPDLVSGTEIVNSQYGTTWTELISDTAVVFFNTGKPVSTMVKEVGLIDSFKTVTPTLVRPGSGNVLTYTVNVVNSGPSQLNDVTLYDIFPWQYSTYQRDAVASAGEVISDIVSLAWIGDVGPFSSEAITFTVVVDDDYRGPLTNTAYIDHSSLREQVIIQAVAYATDQPVLRITKTATPDPVPAGDELLYKITVSNLGQEATNLIVTDMIPGNTQYVNGSSSDGGVLTGDLLRWEYLILGPGEDHSFMFRVKAPSWGKVINDQYQVTCEEGVVAIGEPVITQVIMAGGVYLPIIIR